MVDLAHRSGDRQQDLKSEKRQAQMQVARAQLERLTMLLLTSAKTLLRHPDDPAAKLIFKIIIWDNFIIF
jgi:hypothetical protein